MNPSYNLNFSRQNINFSTNLHDNKLVFNQNLVGNDDKIRIKKFYIKQELDEQISRTKLYKKHNDNQKANLQILLQKYKGYHKKFEHKVFPCINLISQSEILDKSKNRIIEKNVENGVTTQKDDSSTLSTSPYFQQSINLNLTGNSVNQIKGRINESCRMMNIVPRQRSLSCTQTRKIVEQVGNVKQLFQKRCNEMQSDVSLLSSKLISKSYNI